MQTTVTMTVMGVELPRWCLGVDGDDAALLTPVGLEYVRPVVRWLDPEEDEPLLTPVGPADLWPRVRWLDGGEVAPILVPVSFDELEPIRRPKKRSECAGVPRPCPFVSCKYHVYMDVEDGKIARKLPIFPSDLPPEKSCVLDMVELDREYSAAETAAALGLSVAEVEAIESGVIRRFRYHERADKLLPYHQGFLEIRS